MAKDLLQPAKCAELLSALAAPERLNIMRLLTDGERNVTQIIEELKIPALNVSHHLVVLKTSGLIQSEKRGRFVVYSLCDGVLQEISESGVLKESLNLGCCHIVLPKAN